MKRIIVCLLLLGICISVAGCGKTEQSAAEAVSDTKTADKKETKPEEQAGNNNLAFFGAKGVTEDDTCYGYLNLSDRQIHYYIVKNYGAFSLYTDSRFIWLNDGESPYDQTSSGKFPVLDTAAQENKVINLDGIESTKARITTDGKYIIAVNQIEEQGFRVRQYDIETKKVLSERTYSYDKSVRTEDIIVLNGGRSYGITYATDKAEKLEIFELMN